MASFNHKEVRNNKGKNKGKKRGEDDWEDEMAQYKDLIAGSSEESEYGSENADNSEDRAKQQKNIDEMRKKLLSGLEDDMDGMDNFQKHKHNKDLHDSEDDSLDVQFGIGFGEDIG